MDHSKCNLINYSLICIISCSSRQPQNDTVIDLTTDDTTDKPRPLITDRNSHRYNIYIYMYV